MNATEHPAEVNVAGPAAANAVRTDAPTLDPRAFRSALGMFATGVTIVTARLPDGTRLGTTVNSFNSVSLSPALVLWSLSKGSSALAGFQGCSHYAVNVLGVAQQALAERFASRVPDRWAGVAHGDGLGGAPLLPGAVATFECANRSRYDEGDHVIFVGEVAACGHLPDAAPLLFHGGRFYTEHPL